MNGQKHKFNCRSCALWMRHGLSAVRAVLYAGLVAGVFVGLLTGLPGLQSLEAGEDQATPQETAPPFTLTVQQSASETILTSSVTPVAAYAVAPVPTPLPQHGKRVARIIWQNRQTASLHWGEVFSGSKYVVTAAPMRGFPKLDVEKQDLVQMDIADNMLLVGVRDTEGGQFQSGWVSVDTGVREVPHGNHSDWQYVSSPQVRGQRLNTDQGNPAHLYRYDGQFYLANDARNGFTQFNPKALAKAESTYTGQFFPGGGNHITLAAVNQQVCYSTWIDGEGPNKGRIDVVNLSKQPSEAIAYSFFLPTGVIHGAMTNSGKVFFAPSDGVCWVTADNQLQQNADSVQVHHIGLGSDDESGKPFRTGAFATQRNWVMFATGAGENSKLGLIDASAEQPQPVFVSINVPDGLSLMTPEPILAAGGKRYAFLFQDRKDRDTEIQEQLTIVDLDPNGDRSFVDAKIVKTIPVGRSLPDGHYGHHSICFDSEGRHAMLTNPGDESIWVISLADLQLRARVKVGGIPSAIVAIGAPSHH